MSFEKKKQAIINCIEVGISYIEESAESILDEEALELMQDGVSLLRKLQPDVKTCQSCSYRMCKPYPKRLSWKCGYIYSPVYMKEFFGHEYNLLNCIYHKEKEE